MLASTVNELIALFRSDVDDVMLGSDDENLLWKQADALAYFNEGLDRVLKKTETLYRQTALSVTANVRLVKLPPYVRHIREAVLRSTGERLDELNTNDPARFMSSTDYGSPVLVADSTPGLPTAYTRDMSAKGLWLNRIPAAADTIDIQCSAIMSEPLGLEDDLPITDAEDQRLVITFMKYRAYRKHDTETYDLARSNEYKAEFDEHSRERAAELCSVRRAPGTVRMEWW